MAPVLIGVKIAGRALPTRHCGSVDVFLAEAAATRRRGFGDPRTVTTADSTPAPHTMSRPEELDDASRDDDRRTA
jgi:hypothetical protein